MADQQQQIEMMKHVYVMSDQHEQVNCLYEL